MRVSRAVALLSLVGSLLTAGAVASGGPAAAATYAPRWCTSPADAPCLVSATRNGTPVTSASTDWEIDLVEGSTGIPGDDYVGWIVQGLGGAELSPADTWTLIFDTGSMKPRYTEAFAGVPAVTRTDDGDGTWHVTYTAKPVLTTDGCDSSAAWPWPCLDVAPDTQWQYQLSGEIQDRDSEGDAGEFNGFDWSQSADGTNGIFLETAGDGSRYLSSEMVNSRLYDADRTAGSDPQTFYGQARFRVPYQMLKESFGVPNPATMVASSLSGTVNGSATGATFAVTNDKVGKALVVDISDVTFAHGTDVPARATTPVDRIRVRTGTITPTRPTQVSATRTAAHRGFVDFEPSKPRGAKVTGYAARCTLVGGDQVVRGTSDNIVHLTGLRARKAYDCQVRATSAVGPSAWSAVVRMSRTPDNG